MQIPINIEAKNYCFQCISPPSMFKLIQCFNMTRSLYEGDLLNCASVYCLIVSHYLQLFFIDFSLIEMHTHWLRGFLGHLSPDLVWIAAADSLLLSLIDGPSSVNASFCRAGPGSVRRILGGAGDSAVARCHYHYQAVCMLRWSLQHSDHPFPVLVAMWSSIIIAMETDVLLSIGRQKQNSLFPFPLENSLMKNLSCFKLMFM